MMIQQRSDHNEKEWSDIRKEPREKRIVKSWEREPIQEIEMIEKKYGEKAIEFMIKSLSVTLERYFQLGGGGEPSKLTTSLDFS